MLPFIARAICSKTSPAFRRRLTSEVSGWYLGLARGRLLRGGCRARQTSRTMFISGSLLAPQLRTCQWLGYPLLVNFGLQQVGCSIGLGFFEHVCHTCCRSFR